VIEEQQRVEEGMAELVMQWPISVGDVEPRLQHAAGNELRTRRMTLVDKGLVFRLVPNIGAAIFLPRLWRHLVIGQHAERPDAVFLEIFALTIAPDHDKAGVELVEHPAGIAKPGEQALTMAPGGGYPGVVAVFLPHRLGPTLGMAQRLGDRRIVEG